MKNRTSIASVVFLLAFLPAVGQLQAQITVAQELSIRVEIERQITADELVLPPDMTLLEAQNTAVGVVRLLLYVAAQPSLGDRLLTGTLLWTAIAKAMVAGEIDPTVPPPEEPPPEEETPPPPSPPAPEVTVTQILVSTSPDRSFPILLGGATVSGTIYAFQGINGSVATEPPVNRVQYFVDGSLVQTENRAPFDLAGTVNDSNRTAFPFDTSSLANGNHNVTASVLFSDGTTEIVSADFIVSN